MLTLERGRDLLSTPRGGQAGAVLSPTVGLDPGDPAWIAEPDPGNDRTSYQFIFVEGMEPTDLPERLGGGDDTMLELRL